MASLHIGLGEFKKAPESAAPPKAPRLTIEPTEGSTAEFKATGLVLPFRLSRKNAMGATLAPPARVKKEVSLNALLETGIGREMRRSPLEWAGATALHLAVVAALIIVPLYTTGTIRLPEYDAVPLVAPPPPPPPAATAAATAPRMVHPKAKLTYKLQRLTAPTAIPKKVSLGDGSVAPPEVGGVVGGLPGGIVGGQIGGVAGGTGPSAPPPPPQKVTPRLVRVGSNLKAPRQTYSVDPEYPPLALQGHIRGTVLVSAIIDERGNVVQARAISGHPLLIAAALKAVLQWKYEPTSLNGQPISVELQVSVNFR